VTRLRIEYRRSTHNNEQHTTRHYGFQAQGLTEIAFLAVCCRLSPLFFVNCAKSVPQVEAVLSVVIQTNNSQKGLLRKPGQYLQNSALDI
jgi:hypothetical protein